MAEVKKELVDLYHSYLAVTSNQAAAACLCILDVLGQGQQQAHILITGDQTQPAPDTGFTPLEVSHPEPEPVAQDDKDDWGQLLDAYRELKKRG